MFKFSENPLFYLHIPKTAGRTLESILYKNYSFDSVYRIYDIEQYESSYGKIAEKNPKQTQRAQLFMGHIFFGMHTTFPSKHSKPYFSYLRDPIQRVVSLYNYIRMHQKNTLLQPDKSFMGLEQFVQQDITLEINNGQTRMLAGVSEDVAAFPGLLKMGVDASMVSNDSELLDRAKSNIEEYFLMVGVTERFTESLLLLSELMGLKELSYSNRNMNQSAQHRYEIPDSTLALIQEKTELDRQLYDFANDLLTEQLKAHAIQNAQTLLDERSFNMDRDWLRKRGKCLLDIRGRDFPKHIKHSQQLEFESSKETNLLALRSTGSSAHVVLHDIGYPIQSPLYIGLELECEVPSYVQVYYATQSCPQFNEINSDVYRTQAGKNRVRLRITTVSPITALRIDFGDSPCQFELDTVAFHQGE